MDIRIHMTNGKTHRFAIADREVASKVLERLVPNRIFSQKIIQMQGPVSVHSFNPELIEWIEFSDLPGELPATWFPNTVLRALKAISAEQYRRKLQEMMPTFQAVREHKGDRNVVIGLGRGVFTSGSEVYLWIEAKLPPGTDPRSVSVRIFENPGLCCLNDAGAAVIINPQNMQVWEGYPGISEPTMFSIPAELQPAK